MSTQRRITIENITDPEEAEKVEESLKVAKRNLEDEIEVDRSKARNTRYYKEEWDCVPIKIFCIPHGSIEDKNLTLKIVSIFDLSEVAEELPDPHALEREISHWNNLLSKALASLV